MKKLLIISSLLWTASCGPGATQGFNLADWDAETPTTAGSVIGEDCEAGKSTHQGLVLDRATKKPIVDAIVSIQGCVTITGESGLYGFRNAAQSTRAVVVVNAPGYVPFSKNISLLEFAGDTSQKSNNYLEVELVLYGEPKPYDESDSAVIAVGKTSIEIYGLVDDEEDEEDEADVYLKYYSPVRPVMLTALPGNFRGKMTNGTKVQLATYGAIAIKLRDEDGDPLEFLNPATVTFPARGLKEVSALALWHFDYSQGLWIEEGYAELDENGAYQAEIPRAGFWAIFDVLEQDPAIFSERIITPKGDPVSYARVFAQGRNWISTDLTTDKEGYFEIPVMPGESFKFYAYEYQAKYRADYKGSLGPIASGASSSGR